jgi:hypothetical protein
VYGTRQWENLYPIPAPGITSRRQKNHKTTILNITPWGERTCEALRFALANQKRLSEIGIDPADLRKTLGDLKLTQ